MYGSSLNGVSLRDNPWTVATRENTVQISNEGLAISSSIVANCTISNVLDTRSEKEKIKDALDKLVEEGKLIIEKHGEKDFVIGYVSVNKKNMWNRFNPLKLEAGKVYCNVRIESTSKEYAIDYAKRDLSINTPAQLFRNSGENVKKLYEEPSFKILKTISDVEKILEVGAEGIISSEVEILAEESLFATISFQVENINRLWLDGKQQFNYSVKLTNDIAGSMAWISFYSTSLDLNEEQIIELIEEEIETSLKIYDMSQIKGTL